jgi:hypothetical protein
MSLGMWKQIFSLSSKHHFIVFHMHSTTVHYEEGVTDNNGMPCVFWNIVEIVFSLICRAISWPGGAINLHNDDIETQNT